MLAALLEVGNAGRVATRRRRRRVAAAADVLFVFVDHPDLRQRLRCQQLVTVGRLHGPFRATSAGRQLPGRRGRLHDAAVGDCLHDAAVGRRGRLHDAAVGDSLPTALARAVAAATLAEEARQHAEHVAGTWRRSAVVLLMVVQVSDVDDDDADEQLERDARNEHRQHELVEPVTLAPDVEQQLELSNLSQRQDGHERRLCLRLRLLQLAVTSQQLRARHTPSPQLNTLAQAHTSAMQ